MPICRGLSLLMGYGYEYISDVFDRSEQFYMR